MRRRSLKSIVILWCSFLGVLLWFAAKFAMSAEGSQSIGQFKENLGHNMMNFFSFRATAQTAAFLIVVIVVWLIMLANYLLRTGQYMQGKEHGSAVLGDIKKLNTKYRQEHNVILSQNLAMGFDVFRHGKTLNQMIVGGSGTGKTRGLFLPCLLEKVTNVSYVITDPKAEILRSVGGFLENEGYTIRVLNLVDMKNSDKYNPFRYLREDQDIISLITNLIQNTTPPNTQLNDPFWLKAEECLLQALMFYIHYCAPSYERNFGMLVDLLRYAEVYEENESHESPLDYLFNKLKAKNPNHIAVKQYDLFRLAAGKTMKSILISTAVRLSYFAIEAVGNLVSEDTLSFGELATKKMALFCVTSDSDKTFDFLSAMLYTQIIKELNYLADQSKDGRLTRHVRMLFDEFCNVRLMTEHEYARVLSTCRGRNYSITHAIQSIGQLKGLYKDTWENIMGNCDTLIYLGGNEPNSHKMISDSYLGKTTVAYDTYSKSPTSTSTNINILGRELMTQTEVRALDQKECFVFINNEDPVVDKKYDLMQHPNIGKAQQGGAAPYVFKPKEGRKAG